ncbi:MAG: hypothetical protein ABSH24_24990 [Bryobacteraceae bacterium]|jgi:hypothetical protein
MRTCAFIGLLTTVLSLTAERLPMRLYTVADGLARDSVHCVLRDASKHFTRGEKLDTEGHSIDMEGYASARRTAPGGLASRGGSGIWGDEPGIPG